MTSHFELYISAEHEPRFFFFFWLRQALRYRSVSTSQCPAHLVEYESPPFETRHVIILVFLMDDGGCQWPWKSERARKKGLSHAVSHSAWMAFCLAITEDIEVILSELEHEIEGPDSCKKTVRVFHYLPVNFRVFSPPPPCSCPHFIIWKLSHFLLFHAFWVTAVIPHEVAEFVVMEAGHTPRIEVKQTWQT